MSFIFEGVGLRLAGKAVRSRAALELDPGAAVNFVNGSATSECLLQQGKPIAKPVVQRLGIGSGTDRCRASSHVACAGAATARGA